MFERFIQKKLLKNVANLLSPFLCEFREGFSTQFAFVSLIAKCKNLKYKLF